METEENKEIEARRKLAGAARRLEANPDYHIVMDAAKLAFDVEAPSLSAKDLIAPNVDGMTKLALSQRADGQKDVFQYLDNLRRFDPEEVLREEQVTTTEGE